ncbi:CHAT domain-containing tetratricopeptide repeat protein [Massilia puerhi]|uniref:CHAT domain-containing tetratricopeptide repeat protein n=1 Tax=Massilia puerhi TaxID=2681550 RepID=UPI00135B9723|nr:CHAT domain-containing tetratricopeptide repeat protein [Massilia puerhi]
MRRQPSFGGSLRRLGLAAWLCLATGAAAASCQPAADALIEVGEQDVAKGRYPEAIVSFEQALRLCRDAADQHGVSASLLRVGKTLHHVHRYADSEAALLEGWALRQRLSSGAQPDDPYRERMYYPAELMYLYRQWSRYDLAWKWGEEALRIKAQLAGANSSSYGTTLSNVSGIAMITREYARGLPYAREAMDIWEATSGTDSTDHAWGMRDVGVLLLGQGKMQESYHYLERAYRIRLAAFGPDRTETQTSVQDMAAWHTQAGNDAAALGFAELGLASAIRRYGPDAVDISYALARVARIHLRLGESAQAAAEAERVLHLRRTALGEDNAQTMNAWQDVAKTQLANNRLGRSAAAAQAALRACLAIPGAVAASCVAHQLDHARALLALGQAAEALAQAERAAALARSHGELDGDERAAIMLGAQALRTLGRPEQAEDALAGLASRVAALPDPPANGQFEVALALDAVRAERGGADLAALAARSSALAQQVGQARGLSNPAYASALLDAAALHARGSNRALAREHSARAMAIGLANHATLLQARAAAQLSELDAGAHAVFLGKVAVNALQAARENTTGLPVEQQHSFVQLKKAAYQRLVDQLLDRGRIGEAERVLAMVEDNEFHDLVRSADSAGEHDARVVRLRFDGIDAAPERQFALRARSLEQAAQALAQARARQAQGSADGAAELAAAQTVMKDLLDQATEEWGGPAPSTATAASAAGAAGAAGATAWTSPGRATLAPGRLHLTYLVGEQRIRLVVQHGSVARVVTLDADQAGLVRDIAHLRSLAQHPGKDPRTQAQRLFRQLLEPVLPELARARMLTLSLNGVLRYLPFAMLHDGRQWLVERLPLQVTGSADIDGGAARIAVAPRPRSVALFGQSQASGELPALPFVARELQAVRTIGKAGKIPNATYLDAGFTAAALARALQRDSMVHIASHFVLRPGRDDGSYLVLGEGRHLSLAELAQARFSFAGLDLLTLSACETAVPAGVDASGRELAGLAWLARERGARHVLASLWRVSDRSTATLMTDFYGALGRGAGKPEALRAAQVRQIRRAAPGGAARGLKAIDEPVARPSYGHPYYWAGFTLLGS